ncbi:hypothetical protein [Okeania sp. KiyG1]|uniref:hypothetical protein n=1 Tax=Okeania sp. KiyG1 TaxID=2720165 RepID=UPI0019227B40|nr:hypothetical protein [Okeania sp. KiyG1]GGA35409.1 hypothetical protein CYANOKiyG1_53050 [Okeania sp. KiyG1]
MQRPYWVIIFLTWFIELKTAVSITSKIRSICIINYQLFIIHDSLMQDITLEELQENFGLQLTTDSQFFREWQDNLPSLTDEEKRSLERVRSNYFNLVNRLD